MASEKRVPPRHTGKFSGLRIRSPCKYAHTTFNIFQKSGSHSKERGEGREVYAILCLISNLKTFNNNALRNHQS